MPPTNNKKPVRKKKSEEVVIVTDLGRQQPQAVDFEEVVIGACLIEQEAFGQIADILKPGSFYETKHRLIFEAIQSLSAENKPIDILTVTEQMRVNGTLEEAGGPYYIAELSNKVVSSAHIEYHAKIIAQKYLARELIKYASQIQEGAFRCYRPSQAVIQEFINQDCRIMPGSQRQKITNHHAAGINHQQP